MENRRAVLGVELVLNTRVRQLIVEDGAVRGVEVEGQRLTSHAVLLACGGIYGVLAYLTNQRVPEIGVRMALGASGGQVIRMILRQSMRMVLAGAALGTVAAIAAGYLLERLVAGAQATEPLTFVAMLLLMVGAALLASFLPARQASRTDPMRVLRQE